MRAYFRAAMSLILSNLFVSCIAASGHAADQEIVLHCEWSNNGGGFDLDVGESRVLLNGRRLLSPQQPTSDKDIVDISRDYISFSTHYILGGLGESYLLNRKTKEMTYTRDYDANECGPFAGVLGSNCHRDMKQEIKKASCEER